MLKYIQEIFPAVLDMLICMIYFNILLGSKKRRVPTLVWILSYILMEIPIVINSLIFRETPGADNYVLFFTIISLLTLILISFEYVSTIRHRIFAVLSFQVIAGVAEGISTLFQSDSFPISISAYGIYIISKLIICLFVFIIALIYTNKKHEVTVKYSLQLLLIPGIDLFVLFFIWKKDFAIDNDQNNYIRLFISFSVIFICILNYVLLNVQLQNRFLRTAQKRLEEQNALQKKQYDQTISSYRELRSLVHDEKKHLLYMRECILEKEYNKLESYINNNISELESSRFYVNTGNLAIDAMLGSAIQKAKELNCDVRTNIQIDPEEINMTDHDLCVIIGNMSDNALRAISLIGRENKPYLNIELFMTKNQFVIHMINSTNPGKVRDYSPPDAESGNIAKAHGYGLINIHNTVEKYNGLMRFIQNADHFDASVIIPLTAKKEV